MSAAVLVTYATNCGSTQEVAETVAAELRSGGFTAELQPMRSVKTLNGYQAVILGAPLYIGHWHKDTRRFLMYYEKALKERPVAVFALGPLHDEEKEWQEARTQFAQELAKFPWLTPVAIEVMGGVFNPAKLRFPFNLAPILRQTPASDIRDWVSIRTWASNLTTQFQLALA